MKRFSVLATAVVALALGAAACSDTPTQPSTPAPEVIADPSFTLVSTAALDQAACASILVEAGMSENRAAFLCRSRIFRAALQFVICRAAGGQSVSSWVREDGVWVRYTLTASAQNGVTLFTVTRTEGGTTTTYATVDLTTEEVAAICEQD